MTASWLFPPSFYFPRARVDVRSPDFLQVYHQSIRNYGAYQVLSRRIDHGGFSRSGGSR